MPPKPDLKVSIDTITLDYVHGSIKYYQEYPSLAPAPSIDNFNSTTWLRTIITYSSYPFIPLLLHKTNGGYSMPIQPTFLPSFH
jgi:hypothetical protein